jgi:hypothetical protein
LAAALGLAATAMFGCAKGRFVPVSPPGKIDRSGIVFQAEGLRATFATEKNWVRVTLKNVGPDPLRMLWDGALFVDQLGRSWPFKAFVVKGDQYTFYFLRPRPLFGRWADQQQGPYFDDAPETIASGKSLVVYLIPAKNIWPEVGLVLKDRQDRNLPIPRLSLPGQTIRPIQYGRSFAVILIVEGLQRTARRRFTFRYRP